MAKLTDQETTAIKDSLLLKNPKRKGHAHRATHRATRGSIRVSQEAEKEETVGESRVNRFRIVYFE